MKTRTSFLMCAAMCAAGLALATGLSAQSVGDVLINEFCYDSQHNIGSASGPDLEWVELYNTTASAIDLSGWQLADNGGPITLPSGLSIAANGYFVIALTGSAAQYLRYTGWPADYVNTSGWAGLGNSGDGIAIFTPTPTSTCIDYIQYGSGALVRAQSDDVNRDLKDVDDRATKPFEQYEREDAMRRLGKSGDAAAISKLISLLRDDFVNIRTAAARILVTAQGEVDAALVKEGLAHKDAEVRRRSADVLGKRKATAAVEALGKTLRADKDEAVRVACARALGRIGGTDAEAALEKVLKTGDAASGEAAAALGRAGRKDLAGKLADALKAKSAEGAIGALDGLAALGVAQEHLAAIAKTAGHKDWRVRIACAQALGTMTAIADEEAAAKVFKTLLADDDWRVRRRTIEALVDLWQPLGAALLAERLPKEDTALFMDIVHALEDLTGVRHGYLREAWTRWWEGIGSKAELAKRKPRPSQGWLRAPSEGAAGKGEGATATYFKIPVFAQPAAFVFDMSGSMRDPVSRDNGKLRIDLAREELSRTLASMPEGASFNLVIFRYYSEFPVRTEVQRAFSKGVASVNAKHTELANKWIEGMPAVGWGAFYEGIVASLEDPAVQVLYFMSDGAPSRGEFTDRDELVEAVAALRRFSPVVLHTVLVGGGNRDEEFMKTLAESCGGTMADARK